MYDQPQVSFFECMDHEAKWLQVVYYSFCNGLEPAPSDSEWLVPGSWRYDDA